jgi:CHRD domain
MKRFVCLAIAALVVAGCGDDDSPTSPSDVVQLRAHLSPTNEVPPITNAADANASGDVVVTINLTAGTASFFFTVAGFPAGTTLVGAHIHPGAAGTSGGVVISTGITNVAGGNAVPLPDGSSPGLIFNDRGATTTLLQDIVNNPANYYFNVHTTLNPGGAIRGQLEKP